jgi:hypothetical protein
VLVDIVESYTFVIYNDIHTMSNEYLYDNAGEFYKKSRVKINDIVTSKLKLLGITLEDLKKDKEKYNPVNAVDQSDTEIVEQFDVMGIHLLTVKWSGGLCEVIHPEKDETEFLL